VSFYVELIVAYRVAFMLLLIVGKQYCYFKNTNKERKTNMAQLTRDYRETIQNRLKIDPEFARHLLDEAVSEFLNDNPESARILLREIVNATIGFEQLAEKTSKNSKSLHRMLSASGNPSMNNLTNIFGVLKQKLNVNFEIHAVSKAS